MPPSVYFYFPGRTESAYLRERIAETFNPQKKLLKAFVGIMQQSDRVGIRNYNAGYVYAKLG